MGIVDAAVVEKALDTCDELRPRFVQLYVIVTLGKLLDLLCFLCKQHKEKGYEFPPFRANLLIMPSLNVGTTGNKDQFCYVAGSSSWYVG